MLNHVNPVLFVFLFAFCRFLPAGSPADTPVITNPDSAQVTKIQFPTTEEIERADLYFWSPAKTEAEPGAILVLAPGRNGNGRKLIVQPVRQRYAAENNLLLCGVSFASAKHYREKSYSNVKMGSGKLLLAGIELYSGKKDLPILMYGFSAGARFTGSFVENHSGRIIAWCGQAVGYWEDALPTKSKPPGIVATGEYDAGCYHPSILYFQQARTLGKPWIWLCLKGLGHQRSGSLDQFVREFFIEVMTQKSRDDYVNAGEFFDIDTKKMLSDKEVSEMPIFRHGCLRVSLENGGCRYIIRRGHLR